MVVTKIDQLQNFDKKVIKEHIEHNGNRNKEWFHKYTFEKYYQIGLRNIIEFIIVWGIDGYHDWSLICNNGSYKKWDVLQYIIHQNPYRNKKSSFEKEGKLYLKIQNKLKNLKLFF